MLSLPWYRFILGFVLIALPLQAQGLKSHQKEKNLWVSVTAGLLAYRSEPGGGASFDVAYASENYYYSAGIFGAFPLSAINVSGGTSGVYDFTSVNLSFGPIYRHDFFKITYSAGIALLSSERGQNQHGLSVYYLGLPLQAESVFTPIPLFAVGLKVYANINPLNSVVGVNLGLYLGKVNK